LLLLLVPDGRLPSPRWRPVAPALVVSWSVIIFNSAFEPTHDDHSGHRLPQPCAIQALVHPASKVVREGALVIGVANVGAAALAPLLRFRRADPVQRQQLTWFAFVIVLIVVAFLVGIAVQGALPIVATVLVTVGFGGCLSGFRPRWVWPSWAWPPCSSRPAAASSRGVEAGGLGYGEGFTPPSCPRARYALARTLPGRPEIDHSAVQQDRPFPQFRQSHLMEDT
jgi:hypothetical protein